MVVALSVKFALLVRVVRLGAESVVPFSVRLPAVVRELFVLKKLMLPVVPRVNDWPLVVPSVPLPERKAALFPLLAEMEAVGVPPATLVKQTWHLLLHCHRQEDQLMDRWDIMHR